MKLIQNTYINKNNLVLYNLLIYNNEMTEYINNGYYLFIAVLYFLF